MICEFHPLLPESNKDLDGDYFFIGCFLSLSACLAVVWGITKLIGFFISLIVNT